MEESLGEVAGPRRSNRLTIGSLVGLGAGLFCGIGIHSSGNSALDALPGYIAPLGTLWINALQMTVFPLVVTHLISAIVSERTGQSMAKLSLGAIVIFALFLAGSGVFSLAGGSAVVRSITVDPQTVSALAQSLEGDSHRVASGLPPAPTVGGWIVSLVPTNPWKAAADGQLLQVLIFTVLFALALRQVRGEAGQTVIRFFEGLTAAIYTLVRWILAWTPVGVFVLALGFSSKAGVGAAAILAQYTLIGAGFCLAFTILLYPITTLAGGVSIWKFARGVFPSQVVAVTTRSSIASLPAMLDGAEKRLNLKPGVARLALPLAVSIFKVNRTITGSIKLVFVAHLFGVPLELGHMATFLVTVMLLSVTTVGLPHSGGTFRTLPLYVSLGIPVAGIVLLEPVASILDFFQTLVNVTCNMSATTILAQFAKRPAEVTESPGLAAEPKAAAAEASV